MIERYARESNVLIFGVTADTMSKRIHPIWSIPTEELTKVVAESPTLSAVLRHYGFIAEGAHHGILKSRLNRDNIDYSHIPMGRGHNRGFPAKGVKRMSQEQLIAEVLVENSPKPRGFVVRYLKRYKLIPYCCECGNEGVWRGKPLSLQLDHINGVSDDHRLENLRWICPNCHSQTSNYAGKALRTTPPRPSEIDPIGFRRKPRPKGRKYPRPSKEELAKAVWEKPMTTLAKEWGIHSANAIKKWCVSMQISFPTNGYWQRRKAGLEHEQSLNPPKKTKQPLPLTALTQEQAIVIRQRLEAGDSQRKLAEEYGVSRSAIQAARNPAYGTQWGREKHLSTAA